MVEAADVEALAQEFEKVVSLVQLHQTRHANTSKLRKQDAIVLEHLNKNGAVIVGAMQRHLRVLPAQMTRVLNRLEGNKPPFLVRKITPNDRRCITITLTDHGLSEIRRHLAERREPLEAALQELPPEDHATIAPIIAKIRERLEGALNAQKRGAQRKKE